MLGLCGSQCGSAAARDGRKAFSDDVTFGKGDRGRIISRSRKWRAQPVREGKAVILIPEAGDVHYFGCTLCLSLLVMCNLFYGYYSERGCHARDIRQF